MGGRQREEGERRNKGEEKSDRMTDWESLLNVIQKEGEEEMLLKCGSEYDQAHSSEG